MGLDRTGFSQYLTTLHIFTLHTTQQDPNIVPGFALVQVFTEHLDTGTGCLYCVYQTYDLNFITNLYQSTLNTTRYHRASA
ncbi:hypothetical protein BGZ81_004974 [Podila clonocystis]|nr:hypothetical protein BGZ81_004974 [Podila clonocystis]